LTDRHQIASVTYLHLASFFASLPRSAAGSGKSPRTCAFVKSQKNSFFLVSSKGSILCFTFFSFRLTPQCVPVSVRALWTVRRRRDMLVRLRYSGTAREVGRWAKDREADPSHLFRRVEPHLALGRAYGGTWRKRT